MFGLGLSELIIILLVVLVLFGAGKLPGIMGELGRGISLFKKGMSGSGNEDITSSSVTSTSKVDDAPKVAKTITKKKPTAKKTVAKKTVKKKTTTKKTS